MNNKSVYLRGRSVPYTLPFNRSYENAAERHENKRRKQPVDHKNRESGELPKRIKTCQRKILHSTLNNKDCGNNAVYEFSCLHVFCENCAQELKRGVQRDYIICSCCGFASWTGSIKLIEAATGTQRGRTSCAGHASRQFQEHSVTKQSYPPSNVKRECDNIWCDMHESIAVYLSCSHRYCSSCFFSYHKPLIILEEYCCIRCFECRKEMWYRHEELQKKAQETRNSFYPVTSNAGESAIDVNCFIEGQDFNITWKISSFLKKPFRVSVWTDINKQKETDTVISSNIEDLYTYRYPISEGKNFFKLACWRDNEKDKYPTWIGPVDKSKVSPPTLDGELQIVSSESNYVDLSWDHATAQKYVKLKEYVVEKRVGMGPWEECQRVKYPKNSCRVSDLEDGGSHYFRVKVFSSVGEGKEQGTVEKVIIKSKALPPYPPEDVKYEYNSNNAGEICWNHPATDERNPILSYVVYMKELESTNWTKIQEVKSNSTCKWCPEKRMEDYKYYVFKVVSRSRNGDSNPAEIGPVMKKSRPSCPTNLNVIVNEETSNAVASWGPPIYDGGLPLYQYRVEILSKSNKKVLLNQDVHSYRLNCEVDIKQLLCDEYDLQVTAENSKGLSDVVTKSFKKETRKKEEKVLPKPPENARLECNKNEDNTGKIIWDRPASHETHGILCYEVHMKDTESEEWVKIKEVKSDDYWIWCPFKDMKEHKRYVFKIIASNQYGNSDAAETKPVMKKSRPSCPTEVNVMINEETSNASVFWKAPDCDGGLPLLSYKIDILSKSTKAILISKKAGADLFKYYIDISSLSKNEYELRITAENTKGLSDVVTKRFKKEDKEEVKDKPNKPLEVKAVVESPTSIKVSWYTGHVENIRPVRDFVIETRIQGVYSWDFVKIVPRNPEESWQHCIVTDVQENTTHYFCVKSRNEKGESMGTYSKAIQMDKTDSRETSTEPNEQVEKKCSGCLELVKALDSRLSCKHEFCEDCSKTLFESAIKSENGLDFVFYWRCMHKECDEITTENHVEFIGHSLSKELIEEKRQNMVKEMLENPEKGEDANDNADNIQASSADLSKIRGLPNVGMTCYANCIFQVLGQTPNMLCHLEVLIEKYRLDRVTSISGQLLKLLKDINRLTNEKNTNRVEIDTVVKLVDEICLKDPSFTRGEQADCHSFMMALFNAIKEEIKNYEGNVPDIDRDKPQKEEDMKMSSSTDGQGKEKKENQISSKTEPLAMFEGYMCNVFKYQPCSHEEEAEKQMFCSLLIPVETKRSWSVNDGLKAIKNEECFDNDVLPCNKCKINLEGKADKNSCKKTTKRLIFTNLPEVLILQIGKFTQVHSFVRKTYEEVKYPDTLKIKELSTTEGSKSSEVKTYNLYGVALHVGTIRYGGHYTAYVRRQAFNEDDSKTDEWYYCSDSAVQKVSKKDVLNDYRASLLFYKCIS